MIARSWLIGVGVLGALLAGRPAGAADAEAPSSESDAPESGDGDEGDKAEKTEDADGEADAKEAPAPDSDSDAKKSPVEERGKTYHFVGARYRMIVVPKFIVGLFAEGGKTVAVHSFGPEFGIRKDDFEFNFGLWYAAYSMDPTPFKGKDDGEDAWEIVESKVKVVYLTADFLWSHPFTPEWALNYGMGAGMGLVFGALHRTQAFRAADGSYLPCAAPGVPNGQYCGGDNDHYGGYEEPSWADGGSKPVIFPWLAVQTGVRFKPHRNFAGRLDVGFGLSGFFFGVGADYGL